MQGSLRVRDLVIASWDDDRQSIANVLPSGLEPAAVEGAYRVSLAAFRVEGGRVGGFPVPHYAQLNVRTHVTWKDEPALYFVAVRVTAGGLPGALLGAPVRYARLRVDEGAVRAPGRGVSLRYQAGEPTEPGLLTNVGLFENDGVRELRIRRTAAAWRGAELVEPARLDFLLALGFHPRGEPELLYTPRAAFELEVPPRLKSSFQNES